MGPRDLGENEKPCLTTIYVAVMESAGIKSARLLASLSCIHHLVAAQFRSSSTRSLPHPHPTTQRLPQKALPCRQLVLSQLKLIPPNHRTHNERQLHFRHVPAHTASRSIAEGNESLPLLVRQVLGCKPVRAERVSVGTPDGGGVMDGVCRDGENSAGGKGVQGDGDGRAGRDEAREAERGGGVNAEAFRDDLLQAKSSY